MPSSCALYWADLQSVHGFRCYDNIARTRNVSEYYMPGLMSNMPHKVDIGAYVDTVYGLVYNSTAVQRAQCLPCRLPTVRRSDMMRSSSQPYSQLVGAVSRLLHTSTLLYELHHVRPTQARVRRRRCRYTPHSTVSALCTVSEI